MNFVSKKSVVGVVVAFCFCAFLGGALTSVLIHAQNENPTTFAPIVFPNFAFNKNLGLGDRNQDVRQLQIFLNKNTETQIAFSGVGSPSNESTYFGLLTKAAVMRFQTKNNLPSTGFVGVLTRAKLNQMILAAAGTTNNKVATTSSSVVGGPAPLSKEPLPRLYTAKPQQIKKTDTFTLVGAGFLPDNTLHIGSFIFTHVLPEDSSNISFTIPATSTITNGTYPIWLENNYGSSQMPNQPINLVIADSPMSSPVISSVIPSEVSGGQSVIVTGTGFSSSGNSIVSGFGRLDNVSSSGNSISFSPKALLSADVLKRVPSGTSLKIDFYVLTVTGMSNVSGSVNLKI